MVINIPGEVTLLLIVSKQPTNASAGIQRIIRWYMGEAAFQGKNATVRLRVKFSLGQFLGRNDPGVVEQLHTAVPSIARR